ncbi:MAG: molybdenum cofactor guanylyltransferase, partial [Candidatus Krumholzibacteria bacterium]|nr:molybdenum cofactor guanylyltransferase [Candidatus Krumholzibacteria bacterium]
MAQPNGSDSQDDRLAVYILAGGRSTRFGRDKATFEVQGTPMIVHLAQTFAPLARSVTVVAAGAGVYEHLGLRTIGDVIEGKGPVGGLLTALQDHRNQIRVAGAREGYNFREGWILVSACDWVGVRTDWVNKLTAQRHDGAQAVVFRAQRFEPLLGLYHTSACDTIASRMAA